MALGIPYFVFLAEAPSTLAVNLAECDIDQDLKGAPWKVAIAKRLRRETTVGNPWIAERLSMGHRNHVSLLVNRE